MESGAPSHADLPNPVLADGIRWGLAAVLVVQVFFSGLAPTLLVSVILTVKGARAVGQPADVVPLISSAIPWLVFLAAHLAQIHFLRRLGDYPYSNGQAILMALLPGYNLFGSVELYASQAEAMERGGSRPGLALEVRSAAAMATGLAVALAVLQVRWLRPFVMGLTPAPDPATPGLARSAIILSLALLLTRLYVLARLQIATRDLVTAWRSGAGPEPAGPVPSIPGLPGPRKSVAVTGLALAAGACAFVCTGSGSAKLTPASTAIFVRAPMAQPPEDQPEPAPAPARSAVAAPAPKPKTLPDGYLMGGRPLDWWRERLGTLAARQDEAGKQLFNATHERAVANGLLVTQAGGKVQVEASPELISAANAEVSP